MQTITIHPLTENPTKAWIEISKTQKMSKIKLSTLQSDKHVRFVCMSDTHSLVDEIKFNIPDGDIFIHAGDFTRHGLKSEVKEFNTWLGKLPHKHKVVICGNHELSFDEKMVAKFKRFGEASNSNSIDCDFDCNMKQNLTNCIYLEDSSVQLYGIKIYGSPWQPEFYNWAFNLKRGTECLQKWNLIPQDTDILITHGPPVGYGDLNCDYFRAGCVELLTTIQQRVKPKYHVYGHIHEGYGVLSDGQTTYINASTCNLDYEPVNLPIVFDFPLPTGHEKT